LEDLPISQWSEEDVITWLNRIPGAPNDMDRVVYENAINGRVLFSMNDHEFDYLAAVDARHCRVLSQGAAELRAQRQAKKPTHERRNFLPWGLTRFWPWSGEALNCCVSRE